MFQSATADRSQGTAFADSAASSAANSASLGMFRPNESSPISLARKVTVGLRSSRDVASAIRITFSGAA